MRSGVGVRSALTWSLVMAQVLTVACLPVPAEAESQRERFRQRPKTDCYELALAEFTIEEALRLRLRSGRWISGYLWAIDEAESTLVVYEPDADVAGNSRYAIRDVEVIKYERLGRRHPILIPAVTVGSALLGAAVTGFIGCQGDADEFCGLWAVPGFFVGGALGLSSSLSLTIPKTMLTRTVWCEE